jgi:hypothetical protein
MSRSYRFGILMCTLLGAAGLAARALSVPIVSYSTSFSDYGGGSPIDWLAGKGYELKREAGKVVFVPAGNNLVLETKEKAAALLVIKVNVPTYSKIRIKWGVNVFPPGASYVKGIRSEAIMVYVFFGSKTIPSGSSFIPDIPYFIGLSLCESDPVGEGFTGRYFKAGGRYVCISRAQKGEALTTEYAIADAFRQLFGQGEVPAITGLGVAIDTESAKGNGVARSFISQIELLE